MYLAGIIEAVNLSWWWDALSQENKKKLRVSYAKARDERSLEDSDITYTSHNACRVLEIMAENVDDLELSLDVFQLAEKLSFDAVESHYLYMTAWKKYKREDSLDFFESYIEKDISIFDVFKERYLVRFKVLPNYPAFREYAIFLERNNRFEKAIQISQYALELGVPDDTSFERRINKLRKKIFN